MGEHLDSIEFFPWSDNLKTGIPLVDEQHKRLVDLLNELTGQLVLNDPSEISRVFEELADYAKYHFESEELIWHTYFKGDPWLEEHQASHDSFMPTVRELEANPSNRQLQEMVEHIVKFLIRWLAFHIIGSDKRMAIAVHKMDSGFSLDEAKKLADKEMRGSTKTLIETILLMYEGLSSRTLELMRERIERRKAEQALLEANIKLEQLAVTDQLTGLHNRRDFEEIFERELQRAKRNRHTLTYIMFDIDHFKKLNDQYGHAYGDETLRRIGATLTGLSRRAGDFVFRLGGEEFGVLITEQSSQEGLAFAEKIRAGIEGLAIANEGSDVSDYVTVSVGVESLMPESKHTLVYYLTSADKKLYQAKSQGRNQVVS